eukprot:72916-Pyramimonas_sp.AAC.1
MTVKRDLFQWDLFGMPQTPSRFIDSKIGRRRLAYTPGENDLVAHCMGQLAGCGQDRDFVL